MKSNIKNSNILQIIARGSIFGAVAIILYIVPIFKFNIPFLAPSFLDFRFDEVPIFIASFAYGPLTGVFATIVRTIVKLPYTTSFTIGEFSDLIYTLCLILPASILYKKKKNIYVVLVGITLGVILQVTVSLFINVYIAIPLYVNVMNIPEEALLEMFKAVNPSVSNLGWSMSVVLIPFNLLKNLFVIIPTLILYKTLRRIIDRIGLRKKESITVEE